MSQLPLPPELEALLASWRGRLPIGTELEGYRSQDPDATVIYATQPSIRRGEHSAASVWISQEAIEDHGQMVAVAPALDVLVKLAMRRGMPTTPNTEPAPMVALMDSNGMTPFETPRASPKEH